MSYLDNPSATSHVDHEKGPNPLVILLVLALVAGGGYFAYTRYFQPKEAPAAAPQMPPAEVVVHTVAPKDVPLTFEYAGRTAGSREVEIRARVTGILQKRAYTEGQKVKQDDVLFEIDPAPFAAELADAQAAFSRSESDWKRAGLLVKEKALSAREFDEAKAGYEQAKAKLDTAKINLGYTMVTAPISGVTSQESMSEGGLVVANQTLLTRLTRLDPMYVNFSTPDEELLLQRRMVASGEYGMPEDGKLRAEIRFGDGGVYKEEGTVDFTDSLIDPQTGTVSNRAVVPNGEDILLPGQFVRVVVKGFVRKNAIAIPDQAVMQGPQGPFVYVVVDDKAAVRPVVLGVLAGSDRLVKDGLKAGDQVIVEGMIKTRPDAPVKIVDPNAAPAETPAAAPAADKKE